VRITVDKNNSKKNIFKDLFVDNSISIRYLNIFLSREIGLAASILQYCPVENPIPISINL
jgi:hypothetical protein